MLLLLDPYSTRCPVRPRFESALVPWSRTSDPWYGSTQRMTRASSCRRAMGEAAMLGVPTPQSRTSSPNMGNGEDDGRDGTGYVGGSDDVTGVGDDRGDDGRSEQTRPGRRKGLGDAEEGGGPGQGHEEEIEGSSTAQVQDGTREHERECMKNMVRREKVT